MSPGLAIILFLGVIGFLRVPFFRLKPSSHKMGRYDKHGWINGSRMGLPKKHSLNLHPALQASEATGRLLLFRRNTLGIKSGVIDGPFTFQ
jgi:hypothetical protein